jgi:hypothetical protein
MNKGHMQDAYDYYQIWKMEKQKTKNDLISVG